MNLPSKIILTFFFLGVLTITIIPHGQFQDLFFNSINPPNLYSIILAQDSTENQENIQNNIEEKTDESDKEKVTEVEEAPVLLDGKTLFIIKTELGEISPKERAKDMSERIKEIAQEPRIYPDSLKVVDYKELKLIKADNSLIGTFTEEDAEAENLPFSELGNERLKQIEEGIIEFRESRTQQSIIWGIIKALIATTIAIIAWWLLNKVLPKIFDRIRRLQQERLRSVRLQGLQFLSGRQLAQIIATSFKIIRGFLIILLFYIYIPLVLSYFPWTQPLSIKLLQYFWSAINLVVNGIIGYIPNLFIIAVIGIFAYYSIRFSRLFFLGISRGAIRINGFYPEWADPTHNITVLIILGLAAVLIFPYLPASDSAGFQGISLFAGALFTLGSSTIIGNIISGIVLIYNRSFQVNDIINVNDKTGRVIEKTMLSTRIITPDNEIITIPNATLLVSDITNYNSVMRDTKNPLILKTTITLGYDVPWRKVHAILIDAANASEGIAKEPEPFVLQTSLDDFYVSYTLKVFTTTPEKMGIIYSQLHQNIQDKCNEADIEILSPHYSAVRDGHQITIPANYLPEDYKAPGFRLESLGDLFKKNENK